MAMESKDSRDASSVQLLERPGWYAPSWAVTRQENAAAVLV